MSTLAESPRSLISSLVALPEDERNAILANLTDEQADEIRFTWQAWARANQLPPSGDWRVWLLLSGRGFGKTRVGAEWVRSMVQEFEFVNLIGPTAADVRDVMVKGESGIMACCPRHERPVYHPSTRSLEWPNGARSLTFSAEDPEQLRGPQHQRLWCDEIAAWSNHTREETFDLAMLGLRLPPDPRALLTTTPKPVPLLRELVEAPHVAITKGTTYDNAENLAPEFLEQIILKYEGTRMGRQELNAELLLDEGLAYRVIQGTHIVPPFAIDNWWTRFEAMDYGTSNPTSWGCFAIDYDGNIIAFGLHHAPGFPSETIPLIRAAREKWWSRNDQGELQPAICFAPADIRTKHSKSQISGKEISAETEFNEAGIYFAKAQQDRRAGYIRIAESLRLDLERVFPDWHPRARETGSPGFFILDTEEMAPLISSLRDAPLEDPDSPLSKLPGEAVEEDWESRIGHAHAMLRYALMSRPRDSVMPKPVIEDPRAARIAERLDRIAKRQEEDLLSI